jgi:hypothetical protein
MKAIFLITAFVLAGLLGGTAQAATRPSEAYFKVQLYAAQAGGWNLHYVSHSCGGVGWTDGHGESSLRLHSVDAPQTVVARRVSSPEKVAFQVNPKIGGVQIVGNVVRQGEQTGGFSTPPKPGLCPRPEDIPPDCGSRAYPGGTTVGIRFDTPESWDEEFYGQRPLVQSLHLSGPALRGGGVGLGHRNCPGERDDYLLGLHDQTGLGVDSGNGPLSVRTIFSRRRHFAVRGSLQRTDHIKAQAPLSGGREVTVALGWRVKFTRLAHRPRWYR